MNADERRYPFEDLTRMIIGAFFDVHNELGYGFLESIYKRARWPLPGNIEDYTSLHMRHRALTTFVPVSRGRFTDEFWS